jgi:hypothetical protein
MNAEFRELLTSIVQPPRLRDLQRERETACMAIKEFGGQANHYLQQKRLAELRLAEIDAQIKQHYGVIP